MARIFYALVLVKFVCGNTQLEQLISFARGQGQAPQGRPTGARAVKASSIQRHPPPVAPPIPFAELADPQRGVVALDVPQPARSVTPSAPTAELHSHREDVNAGRRNRFLPAGATQVGGEPLACPKTKKPQASQPTPLSEINPPVFLSNTFPSPLNDVAPTSAPLLPPPDSLRHSLPAGLVPRARAVPASALPEMLLLASDEIGQRGVDTKALDYDRFGNRIWQDATGRPVSSAQLDGVHDPDYGQLHPGYLQADQAHTLALQRHRESLQKVLSEQGKSILNSRQSLAPPEPASHFAIPGRQSLEAQQQELKLAEEALKRLG